MPPYTGTVFVGPRGKREAVTYRFGEFPDKAAVEAWLTETLPAAQQWVADRFRASGVIRDGDNIAATGKLRASGNVKIDWVDPAVIAQTHQPTGDPDGDKRGLCTCGWPTNQDWTNRGPDWTPQFTLHVLYQYGADTVDG